MRTRALVASLFVACGLAAVACAGKKPPPKEPMITETVADAGAEVDAEPPKPKSLYERLGGKDALAKVVDTLMKNIEADTKLNKRFAKVKGPKMEAFKKSLADQLCEVSGGDCKYGGKSMKDAHKGMKIKDDEWNAFLADLKAALEEHKIPDAEQGDLMALLGPMHDEIVETKPTKKP